MDGAHSVLCKLNNNRSYCKSVLQGRLSVTAEMIKEQLEEETGGQIPKLRVVSSSCVSAVCQRGRFIRWTPRVS